MLECQLFVLLFNIFVVGQTADWCNEGHCDYFAGIPLVYSRLI